MDIFHVFKPSLRLFAWREFYRIHDTRTCTELSRLCVKFGNPHDLNKLHEHLGIIIQLLRIELGQIYAM